MGTYDQLMKLGPAKKVQKPKPETPPHDEGATSIPQSKSAILVDKTPKPREKSLLFQRDGEAKKRMIAGKQSSYHAIKQAGYHDSIVELIRKAVRFVGKDPFFGRFTPEEKMILADIAYTYKRNGVKTSENEIARIAVNFIVSDYKDNGENSVLDRVLRALNT